MVPLSLFADPGANPEKTLHIRGGAMQVYHQNPVKPCSPSI